MNIENVTKNMTIIDTFDGSARRVSEVRFNRMLGLYVVKFADGFNRSMFRRAGSVVEAA